MNTIGFLETTSIAAGVEIADKMIKASNVELIFARTSCPGKYHVLITGEVSAVEMSLKEGKETGKGFVVNTVLIPRVHPQVIQAINCGIVSENIPAIGILEYFSVTASLQAADTAVKAAKVDLMDIRLGTGIGGKSFVMLTGEISSVQNAVKAALNSQENSDMLLNYTIVTKPRRELIENLY